MASPVRFPQGLSTFPPKSILGSYPISTSSRQIAITDDFIPYRAGDYTVTTAVAGTAASFAWPSGAIKLATSANATDTIYLQRNGAAFQFGQGNQMWYDIKVAYPRSVNNTNDTNIYMGLGDGATFALSNNFIGFLKPSGGTAVHFIIKKATVVTTFQNIGDLGLPSGLYGDTNSINGTINTTVAGNAITATSIATPGAGYQCQPLVLSTTTSGAAGLVPVLVQPFLSAVTQGNPAVPISSTQLPYLSLGAPSVVNPAAGSFTNTASVSTYLEVEPVIDLQFWLDPKGVLQVGVNGRVVMKIEGTATTLGLAGVAASSTVNVATAGPSFYSTTQISTALMPFQPAIGSAFNLIPLVPMNALVGMTNTSANIRNFYVMEYNVAVELN